MSSYKFRILIDTEKDEDIFRDIIINPTDSFEVFYRAIIASFDFVGKELASFYVSNDNWDKGHEIALMDMGLGNDLNAPFIMIDTPISTVVRTKGQKLVLVYDFLKMWCFLIELVEIMPDEFIEPELYLSIGAAPHEDSKEIDFANSMGMGQSPDLGNDIDDIFSEFGEDDDDFGGFENIDDYDI
ncbi:MAG: hypothetical protein P8I55_00585 [Crocinitomix sp.]|nr:hypothetical protein [Crocinitomix sp.]